MRRFIIIFLILFSVDVAAQAPSASPSLSERYTDSLRTARHNATDKQLTEIKRLSSAMLMPTADSLTLSRIFALDKPGDTQASNVVLFLISHPELAWPSGETLPSVALPSQASQKPTTIVQELTPLTQVEAPMPEHMPMPALQTPRFWDLRAEFFLQFMQNFISSNWYNGGESNYSILGTATLGADYDNRQRLKISNLLELKLGYIASRSDLIHRYKTSDDLIRLTSKIQRRAFGQWWYTIQLVAATQFTRGYKANDPNIYSDFLSPLTLSLSAGLSYQLPSKSSKLKGNILLAPLSLSHKFVERRELAERYGLDPGHHTMTDMGPLTSISLTWQPTDAVRLQTRLHAFTTFSRAELEWESTLTLRFNRYLSANIFVYPRFDDNVQRTDDHSYWQLREFTSFGFSLSL